MIAWLKFAWTKFCCWSFQVYKYEYEKHDDVQRAPSYATKVWFWKTEIIYCSFGTDFCDICWLLIQICYQYFLVVNQMTITNLKLIESMKNIYSYNWKPSCSTILQSEILILILAYCYTIHCWFCSYSLNIDQPLFCAVNALNVIQIFFIK